MIKCDSSYIPNPGDSFGSFSSKFDHLLNSIGIFWNFPPPLDIKYVFKRAASGNWVSVTGYLGRLDDDRHGPHFRNPIAPLECLTFGDSVLRLNRGSGSGSLTSDCYWGKGVLAFVELFTKVILFKQNSTLLGTAVLRHYCGLGPVTGDRDKGKEYCYLANRELKP